jgi:hypothetical protein
MFVKAQPQKATMSASIVAKFFRKIINTAELCEYQRVLCPHIAALLKWEESISADGAGVALFRVISDLGKAFLLDGYIDQQKKQAPSTLAE